MRNTYNAAAPDIAWMNANTRHIHSLFQYQDLHEHRLLEIRII
jgi:hypothetical protein